MTSIRFLPAAALVLAASLGPAALAASLSPPGALADWTCTGLCGASAADGDITLSPFGSTAYGFVATSGSAAYAVSPLQLDSNSRGSGTEANGSRIVSGVFHAAAGDQLDLQFNFVSTDGKGFDDYAWARLVNAGDNSLVAWLFTARSSNSGTKNIVPGDVVSKSEFDPRDVIVNYDSYDFHSKTVDDPIDWTPLGGSNGTCWKDNAAGCGFTGWLQSRHAFAGAGDYRVEFGVTNWGDEAYDSGLAFDFVGLSAAVPEPASLPLMLGGLAIFSLFALRRQHHAR